MISSSQVSFDSNVTHFSIERHKKLHHNDIIYFETIYQPQLNKFIVENIDTIKRYFSKNDKNFVYLPIELKRLIQYYFPEINQDFLTDDIINNYIQETYKYLYNRLGVVNTKELSGLVAYKKSYNIKETYEYFPFPSTSEILNSNKPEIYFRVSCPDENSEINSEDILTDELSENILIVDSREGNLSEGFSNDILSVDNNGDSLVYDYNEDSKKLISEIWDKINELNEMGISYDIVLKLIKINEKRKLSRLIITSDYKIFLPDFNDLEIVLSPLPKTVFLLFLRHPEGIRLKNLFDYKTELIQIYQKISSRDDIAKAYKSINDLIDPTNNSINEKNSRIRESFVQHFNDDIAKYYYITGKRAMPKKILISRSLVEWQ